MTPDATKPAPEARKDGEPTADWSPMPIALVVLFALLAYWGMLYLDEHGGGFNPKVYPPYGNLAMIQDLQPVTDITNHLIHEGEKIFNANCAVCHQNSGIGNPANGCPPLVGSDWATGGGPNRIIRLVLNGGIGPITVKSASIPGGQQYPGTTTMTPFRDLLKDDFQVAAALSYVRNAWGNKAPVVLPEQVKKIRDATADRGLTRPWQPAELLQIPDSD
jgi:mono/diheme cytochrome c family protein